MSLTFSDERIQERPTPEHYLAALRNCAKQVLVRFKEFACAVSGRGRMKRYALSPMLSVRIVGTKFVTNSPLARRRRAGPRRRRNGILSQLLGGPFDPVFAEELDGVLSALRAVATSQVIGWAISIAAPAHSLGVDRI
jgi:hypothetical protein